MTVRITISLDKNTEHAIRALARKRKKTVSGLISEFINDASKEEKINTSDQGLGSVLRTHRKVLKEAHKDYKTILAEIREEKFNTNK